MMYANQQQSLPRAQTPQDTFGRQVAAHLAASTAELPYDISERLRAARVQALSKRKVSVRVAPAVVANGRSGALALGADEGPSFWTRLASVLPLVALVTGLVLINMAQNESRAREVAEIDTALLIDDLPPSAYADPGFMQFLRASAGERTSQTP